jgi:hypothetical protein
MRESIYDEHVHDDGNQLLLSFFSSSSSSVCTGKEKRKNDVRQWWTRPTVVHHRHYFIALLMEHDRRKRRRNGNDIFSLLPIVRFFSPSSPSSCQMSALVDEGGGTLMGCYIANGRRIEREREGKKESSCYSCHPSNAYTQHDARTREQERLCVPYLHRISTHKRNDK